MRRWPGKSGRFRSACVRGSVPTAGRVRWSRGDPT
jgi:hypothetical protein